MATIGGMKKNEEMVKTTIRLPRSIWRDARVRALDEGIDLQDLVSAALTSYLKTPLKREGSR
jgi:hypothetical protein